MICTRLLPRTLPLTLCRRHLANRPGATKPNFKGTVLMYKIKWDQPWVFGLVGTLGTGLGVSGIVIVQQMIKGRL